MLLLVLEHLPSSPPQSSGLRVLADWGPSWLPTCKCCMCLDPHFLQKEEYHTHLAVLYLDEVLQHRPDTSGNGAGVSETQAKLRRLLQKSDLYRVHFLLGEDLLSGGRGQRIKASTWLLVLVFG